MARLHLSLWYRKMVSKNPVKEYGGEVVEKMPLQCRRMATVAAEYCTFIDEFNGQDYETGQRVNWLMRLEKLLPRLHVAVIALAELGDRVNNYRFHNDDQRCELFLRLNLALQSDHDLWATYEAAATRQQSPRVLCERMADNLTDIYFDLKQGLELVRESPARAALHWQRSFYAHWGKHLMDAECWLHSIDAGGEPPNLPEWHWPNVSGYAVNQV